MKKLNSLLLLSAVAGTLFFASCKEETTAPTISIEKPTDGASYKAGENIPVKITIASTEKLKKVTFSIKNGSLEATEDSAVTSTKFEINDTIAFVNVGAASITITAIDAKDNTTTRTVSLTITDAGVKLTESTNGVVANIQGPDKGAFDLVTGAAVSSSANEDVKDIKDQSTVSGTGVVFAKTWGTGNGTKFVKAAASFDYANASNSSAAAAFAAGTSASSTAVLAAGDVYILQNSRYTNGFVVVKITAVNETAADNKDNITFTYKK